MAQKENNKQDKKVASSKKAIKDDKEAIKQKQLAYLKQHEQEIIDYVKAQNPKVESVQIDWEETQWSDGGLTNPEYYINVFGRINNIEESGWGVDIPIDDDNTVNIDDMYLGSDIRIKGRLFD
ncbi:lipoprotein [Streptococcus sanguinis]|uniref:Lipoprotein n=1 Tax=Streptococcus sanguinis TaxID=1305 RepID=A0AAJ5TA34_STRSA|nr:lipoprotein [Streptococcus sanguinis]